jgi:flagellar motility protein MotE (MotC chaperone)
VKHLDPALVLVPYAAIIVSVTPTEGEGVTKEQIEKLLAEAEAKRNEYRAAWDDADDKCNSFMKGQANEALRQVNEEINRLEKLKAAIEKQSKEVEGL